MGKTGRYDWFSSFKHRNMSRQIILLMGILFVCLLANAQQKDQTALTNTDTVKNYSKYKRKLNIAGLLQTRYIASLTKNVDVNGKNFDPATTKGVSNTFLVKRARVMVVADINDHFSANVLANFADFNGNPSNKVLENAYIKYSLNKYFHVQAGQFRPFFGIENAVPVDIIRTLDYSNQYYAFGNNGWQSFQVGVSVFGSVLSSGRLRYFAGAYNGNNKDQAIDDDNTKNLYARLEGELVKNLTIGVNGGTGSLGGSGTGSAVGVDATAKVDMSEKWKLSLSAEYKSGSNFVLYNAITQLPKEGINQYRMMGFYVFPTLRYENASKRVRAIELSSRYEYFDENYRQKNNPRQTIIPNLTLIFADDFYAALQMGVSKDIFKKATPLTTTNNHSMAYVQLQIRL